MTTDRTIDALLERHGRTYADELGIEVNDNTPSPLFRLLCASMLYSARISSEIATKAAAGLADAGWTTAEHLADSSWDERVDVLNEAGYTRYQERTATMLGDTAELVRDRWRGDLRRLRDEADRDPARERQLLGEIKGLGGVGIDILFRELQVAWSELYPFLDERTADAAQRLDLPTDAERLANEAGSKDRYVRIVAALTRTELADDFDAIRKAARDDG